MVVILCTILIAAALFGGVLSLSDSALRGVRQYQLLRDRLRAEEYSDEAIRPAVTVRASTFRPASKSAAPDNVVPLPARTIRPAPLRAAA